MKRKERLSFIMYVVLAVWVVGQMALIVYFWDKPQGSDQGAYMKMAKQCFEAGEWYPGDSHLYESFIWAPGFINYLILQLHLFGTLKANLFFNLFMNIAIVAEIYYLGNRFFSKKTAQLAVIIWCFLYSNMMAVIPAGTEIPFLFSALTAFCLCLHPRILFLSIAGLLFTLANWVRPLAVIFLAGAIVYMLWKKYAPVHYLSLLLPLLLLVFLIGKTAERRTGYFIYQSTTSGINLIMTANDKAYGGIATSLINDSTSAVFIDDREGLTFFQKDSVWKARSIQWIKAHPARYGMLYVKKLAGLYVEDSWSDRPILGGDGFVDSYVVAGKVGKSAFIARAVQMGLKSLTYYFALVACCYGVITSLRRKTLLSGKGILLFILLAGTLVTCIFCVSPRYHYPYLFVVILFAASGVETFPARRKKS
ncbi:MAG: glycosyltransferase family 39 protein [Bacteroidales bacterium]|jgi:hypothetical protein|nr:glycosyltransferase family 39 protein [Bacteroidales bacterium]